MNRKTFPVFALLFCLLPFTACKPSPEKLSAPLQAAVLADSTAEAVKLLGQGADANGRTAPNGWSLLHYAARNGNAELVQALLKAGADANYAGAMDGNANSAAKLKPLLLAQAIQDLVSLTPVAEMDETLREAGINDPALLKSVKDATAADRYRMVVGQHAQVTK